VSLTQQKIAEREAAKAQPRRRRLGELGGVRPLPEYAAALAPRQVADASREFERSLARLSAARANVTKAKQGVEDAQWADEAAARKAAGNGGKAPKRTAPAARAAVGDYEAMVPAAEFEARSAQAAYVEYIGEHREEMTGAVDTQLRIATGEIAHLCDQLESALLNRDNLTALADELNKPVAGRHPAFNPRTKRLGAKRTAALAELRASEPRR
jgi:hypothetical protein